MASLGEPQQHGFMIADPMGAGKTIQALRFLVDTSEDWERILLLCPATLCLMWQDEARRFLPQRKAWKWNPKEPAQEGGILISSYTLATKPHNQEKIQHWLDKAPGRSFVVMDEIHRTAGRPPKPSRMAQMIWGAFSKKDKVNRMRPLTMDSSGNRRFVLGLSGTPAPNGKNCELFSFLRHCLYGNPSFDNCWADYHSFSDFFMNIEYNRKFMKGRHFTEVKERDNRNSEIFYDLLSTCQIRRPKKAFVDLPQKSIRIIRNKTTPALKAQLKEALAHLPAGSHDYHALMTKDLQDFDWEAASTALRHIGMFKVGMVVNHVKEMRQDEPDEPVVVFVRHRDVFQAMWKSLTKAGLHVKGFDGTSSMEERNEEIQAFQNGMGDVFLATIKVAGTGITLTRSCRVVMAELDWVPGEMVQAEDRCHRYGQDRRVLVDWMVISDTIDDALIKVNDRKQIGQTQILTGKKPPIKISKRKPVISKPTSKADQDWCLEVNKRLVAQEAIEQIIEGQSDDRKKIALKTYQSWVQDIDL